MKVKANAKIDGHDVYIDYDLKEPFEVKYKDFKIVVVVSKKYLEKLKGSTHLPHYEEYEEIVDTIEKITEPKKEIMMEHNE